MKIERLNENYTGSGTGGTRTFPNKLTPDRYDLENETDEIDNEGDDVSISYDEIEQQQLMKEPNDKLKPGPFPKGPGD